MEKLSSRGGLFYSGRDLYHLESSRNIKEICILLRFLTGNPCSEYRGYREYVLVILPQLKFLDGIEITRTERILARSKLEIIRDEVLRQEQEYFREFNLSQGTINETAGARNHRVRFIFREEEGGGNVCWQVSSYMWLLLHGPFSHKLVL